MSLLTNLVSYWKLDEASGTRVDSHGTNPLTPTNAPVGAAGKLGNGCDFESSSSQSLSHADPSPLGNEDFTYTLWFKRESAAADVVLLSGTNTATVSSYFFLIGSDGRMFFMFGDGSLNAYTTTTPYNDTTNWHFIVGWHDATADLINLQIDNGTVFSAATGGVLPANMGPVRVGVGRYATVNTYFDGLIDEVGLWRRVLTAPERTALYNAGAGLAYPFGVTATYADRVFADGASNHWKLDEPSGTTATDVIGGKNGTISGGVTLGVSSPRGGAMTFNGTTGKIVTVASMTLPAVPFSVEAWMKTTGVGIRPIFSTRMTGATGLKVVTGMDNQKAWAQATTDYFGTVFLNDVQWHHVVIHFRTDFTAVSVYVDGVYENETSLGTPTSVGTISLGWDEQTNTFWIGSIDNVAIYPLALSPAQIAAHYAAGTTAAGGGGGLLLGVG